MSNALDEFNKIPDLNYEEKHQGLFPNEFDKILQSRRSIRVYEKESIPDEIIQKVLEWGLLAPNSSNLQAWEFHWIKDPRVKEALDEACLSQPAAKTAPHLIVAVAKLNTWNKRRLQMLEHFSQFQGKVPSSALFYYQKIARFMYEQGPLGVIGLFKKFVFFIRGFTTATPREPTSRSDMRVWAVKTTALACENIMLGFSAYGYDTCPMEGFDSKRVKKILNLKCDDEIVMIISAGKRSAKGVYGPRIRFDSREFIKII